MERDQPIDSENNLDKTSKKSKSQIKREYLALQALGKALIELSPKQLQRIPLNEKLVTEITAVKQFKKSALKRQLQYIGGLFESEALDTDLIQQKLQDLLKPGKEATQKLHQVEIWRDELIKGDKQLLQELCEEYFDLDIQQLRQLIRNAQKEQACNQPPRAQRKLFKMLSDIV